MITETKILCIDTCFTVVTELSIGWAIKVGIAQVVLSVAIYLEILQYNICNCVTADSSSLIILQGIVLDENDCNVHTLSLK